MAYPADKQGGQQHQQFRRDDNVLACCSSSSRQQEVLLRMSVVVQNPVGIQYHQSKRQRETHSLNRSPTQRAAKLRTHKAVATRWMDGEKTRQFPRKVSV